MPKCEMVVEQDKYEHQKSFRFLSCFATSYIHSGWTAHTVRNIIHKIG